MIDAALRIGYEGVARLATALAAVVPHSSENKVLRSLALRDGALERFEAIQRDPAKPLLWMHAPSVGEGLQARPVLELVRARRPQTQLAYTYFSPSASSFASRLDVDFRDVLPFDASSAMRRALEALSPTALIFAKLDVWPTLVREASRRGVRTGLVSATLAPESSRRSGLGGSLLREAYARLDRVGAISVDDADRLTSLGVSPSRVTVTGDTRYDQAWEKATGVSLASALLAPLASDRPTLVAGSTWPSDEAVLLAAWSRISSRHPTARLVIAPHEPTASHLIPIERWAARAGLSIARLGSAAAPAANVILIDRVGVLGDLYALGTMAYVGGGHHAAGLHSVLEPAAFGIPVLFGPRHGGSRDAGLLMDDDAAEAPRDADALVAVLEKWISDDDDRAQAGAAARNLVRRGLGAAERSYQLVAELLG